MPPRRRGRFAPSPTGPLHLGSLLAAVGSYLDARAAGGDWLVRIEDVDRARESPGAADRILRTLEDFGLDWDGPVLRQSTRDAAYEAALARLAREDLVYYCSCTRAEIASAAAEARIATAPAARQRGVPPDAAEVRYPGRCRSGPARPGSRLAVRFRTVDFPAVTVVDRLQSALHQEVGATVGDFVLKRRDGFYAYQLAVVVDDAEQGITDVVRGLDLYDNTPRQRLLQAALGAPEPTYLHLPLVLEGTGAKLSKSHRALPADPAQAPLLLSTVLGWLRHPPPAVLRSAPVREQLAWAVDAWDIKLLQGVTSISAKE